MADRLIWDDSKVVAFDYEASGKLPEYALQPWRIPSGDMWATSMSAIRWNGQRLVTHGSKLFPTAGDMRVLFEEAIREGWTIVGWNIVYDISVAIGYGLLDLVHQVRWMDAMLLWKHLEIEPEYEFQTQRHKKKSYRLKPDAHERWLPSRLGRHEDVDFHATDPESLAKLQRYNDDDSVDTWLIGRMIWAKLTERQRRCALIDMASLSMIAEANYRGLPVDGVACAELDAWLKHNADTQLEILAPHGMTEVIARSPMKLSALMFDPPEQGGWGLPVLKVNKSKTTGKETRSTDKEVLHELAFQDTRCKDLRAYREALNNRTKFAVAPANSATYNSDGTTHPLGIPFGTYSGRLTYSSKQGKNKDERQTGFAIHQMKRYREEGDERYRMIIGCPPGYTLMEFDASGQEYRWMATASEDPVMLQLCQPGEDPHGFMGSRIVHRPYRELVLAVHDKEPGAKAGRQLGKVANLSLQYRTSARKLRVVARVDYNIPMEMHEATRIRATYLDTYKRIPIYWEAQIALTKKLGYVETLGGRRVQVVGNWDGDWGWSMGSTAINYRIQGTGADQKYLALSVIKPYLTRIGAYFAWDLHDGIYLYVPNDKVEQAAVDIKFLLDNLPYQKAWGFTPPVPMPWDCKVGASWGALEEWNYA